MESVVQLADRAGDATRSILTVASEIGGEAGRLRGEVEQFLGMVHTDAGERRRAERLEGGGIVAMVRPPGSAAITAAIRDLSHTDVALQHSGSFPVGQDLEIDLPEAAGPVMGRVVSHEGGILAIQFRDDAVMLARIGRALSSLALRQTAAA